MLAHNRYEVGCSCCGTLEFANCKFTAIQCAENALASHTAKITILDRMARVGEAELWEVFYRDEGLHVHAVRIREEAFNN